MFLSGGVDTEEFKECDLVMLSDIHRCQKVGKDYEELEIDKNQLEIYLKEGWEVVP